MKSLLLKSLITMITLVGTSAMAADLQVKCYKAGVNINSNAVPLIFFVVANNESKRLQSDVLEQRSATDVEFLPYVSQFKIQPLDLFLETDDGGATGTVQATLHGIYSPKKSGEVARYIGYYKRVDSRRLSVIVTCVVK